MRWENVVIAGLGYELGSDAVGSEAIEARLAPLSQRPGRQAGRLELMTGIRARRFWPGEVRPSEVAARAGARALERAQLPRSAIGAVIHASVCRDFLEPATANVVHHRLELPATAQVFDVSNACLGVLNGLCILADQIELGRIDAGLVVSGEDGRPLLEGTIAALSADAGATRRSIKSAFASLTIGAGAAAVVLARRELAPGGHRLTAAVVGAATEHSALCRGGAAGGRDTGLEGGAHLLMSTDAEALLHAGIELAAVTWRRLRAELGEDAPLPDRVITHQVGKAHDVALFGALGLDRAQGFVTYDRLGNMGSASLPVTLALAEEAGHLSPGQRVALLGIGSGLSSIMAEVVW